jgi:hypothetical protein
MKRPAGFSAIAHMPVRSDIREVGRVNLRVFASANNNGSFCSDNQEAKTTARRGLTSTQFTPGGA